MTLDGYTVTRGLEAKGEGKSGGTDVDVADVASECACACGASGEDGVLALR
jgi:hypothetical protein